MSQYTSELLNNAVNTLSMLPGIGKRTALRLALFILKQDTATVKTLGNSLIQLNEEIKYCKRCHNISNFEICECCSSPSRDKTTVCVVEDIRDFIAIENTMQYNGVYHILGGIISPMEGIGPENLNIESLISKADEPEINEIILALPTTIEGDTTGFYIYKKLKERQVRVSSIAKGISIGDELEYADEVTLGRSIINRVPYNIKG